MRVRSLIHAFSIGTIIPCYAIPRGTSSKEKQYEERILKAPLYGQMGGSAATFHSSQQTPTPNTPNNTTIEDGFLSLPKALSDHTASLWNGKVYIAGGCDSPYMFDRGHYNCVSLSNGFYRYDPLLQETIALPNLPSARYRHTSAAIHNEIWVIGGRDLMGNPMDTIEVSQSTIS